MSRAPRYRDDGREEFFAAEQNALVVEGAEAYYRAMVRGGPDSWNIRDHHMIDTLDRLMRHHGPDARGIVWEHNTHVGDARAEIALAGMHRPDRLDDLLGRGALDHVAGGAGLERAPHVFAVGVHRQHDHPAPGIALQDGGNQLPH